MNETVSGEPLLQASAYETAGKRRRCQRPTVSVLRSVLIADQRVQCRQPVALPSFGHVGMTFSMRGKFSLKEILMKRTLMVLGASSAFAIAATAHAQSSVTLYGLIDAGLTYTNNQGGRSNFQETSGSVNGSRFGLRGSEDLGGGLKAVFVLENGFNIANGKLGQNGLEFGRQAFVGLSSEQFGTVTLGRQYDSVVDYLAPLSLTGTGYGGTQAAHPFDNDNLDNSFRINNSIKYASVNYGGLKFGGLYGFSNSAGTFATNRAYSMGASYPPASEYLSLQYNR
jgi:predicted porin